jgi:hypothetical protein
MIAQGIAAPVAVLTGTTEKMLAIRYNNPAASQTAEILNVFSRRNLKSERIFARGSMPLASSGVDLALPFSFFFLPSRLLEALRPARLGFRSSR